MSSSDRLAVLRERNKELLVQLRQRGEKLQNLTCNHQVLPVSTDLITDGTVAEQNQIHGSLRGSEAEATMDNQQPEEMVTMFDGDRGSVRAALTKPSESFVHNETMRQTSGATGLSRDLFKDGNRRPDDTRQHNPRPHLFDRDKERRETANRVTFQSSACEQMSASDRQYVQPLLGYDWIAGILDVESSLLEHSDEFFNDLLTFRSVNQDKCVHRQQEGFPEDDFFVPPLLIDDAGQEAHMDTHQCTFCYRLNSRLFPIPLDPEERCPVCKKPKSLQPHTTAEPAFIRVSIPCSTLLPTYKYKPHRRCSFDPSDSLGLPSHCLSGWSNTGQNTLSQPSTLDLQSNLDTKTSAGRPLEKLQHKDHLVKYCRTFTVNLDLSVSRVSGSQRADSILDVSRLARYRFQQLSQKNKLTHPTI